MYINSKTKARGSHKMKACVFILWAYAAASLLHGVAEGRQQAGKAGGERGPRGLAWPIAPYQAMDSTRRLQQTTVVDASQSLVYSGSISGPVYAGQWTTITVQLSDPQGEPDTAFFDPSLTVTCQTDARAPANSSFCYVQPFLQPQGNGLYRVQLMVGTIWGARAQWPPISLGPLPKSFFQGNNSLVIMYGSDHLPGSPFPMQMLQPEPLVSLQYTSVSVPSLSVSCSQTLTQLVNLAQLYDVMDRFGNWIRTTNLPASFWAMMTPATGGPPLTSLAPLRRLTVSWFRVNWGLAIDAALFSSGNYTLQVFYVGPDNTSAPVRLINPDRSSTWAAALTVRPGKLNSSNYAYQGTGAVVAGVAGTVAVMTARDTWLNPTFLVNPVMFDVFREYSLADQNTSFLQMRIVSAQPSNATLNVFLSVNSSSGPGVMVASLLTTAAGRYNLTLAQGNTTVIAQQFDVSAGPATTFSLVPPSSRTAAGLPFSLSVTLADEFSNPVLQQKAEGVVVRLTSVQTGVVLVAPTLQLADKGGGDYTVTALAPTRSGAYLVSILCSGLPLKNASSLAVVHIAANPTVSGLYSGVSGYGAGTPLGGTAEDPTLLTAGGAYTVYVQAYDIYGNKHDDTHPGFQLEPAFSVLCSSINVTEPGDGRTLFSYVLTAAGTYNLTVMTRDNQTAYQGSVAVHSAVLCVTCSRVNLTTTITAGSLGVAIITAVDAFGNPITDDVSYALDGLLFPVQDAAAAPIQAGKVKMMGPGEFRFAYNLSQAQQYQVQVSFQGQAIVNGSGLITVQPGPVVTSNTLLAGGSSISTWVGATLSLPLIAKDLLRNTVTGVSLASNVTSVSVTPAITPASDWTGYAINATDGSAALIIFRSLQAGMFRLQASINGAQLPMALDITVAPSPPPPPRPSPPPLSPSPPAPVLPASKPPVSIPPAAALPPAPLASPSPASSSNTKLSTIWVAVIAVACIAVAGVCLAVVVVACKGRDDGGPLRRWRDKWQSRRSWNVYGDNLGHQDRTVDTAATTQGRLSRILGRPVDEPEPKLAQSGYESKVPQPDLKYGSQVVQPPPSAYRYDGSRQAHPRSTSELQRVMMAAQGVDGLPTARVTYASWLPPNHHIHHNHSGGASPVLSAAAQGLAVHEHSPRGLELQGAMSPSTVIHGHTLYANPLALVPDDGWFSRSASPRGVVQWQATGRSSKGADTPPGYPAGSRAGADELHGRDGFSGQCS